MVPAVIIGGIPNGVFMYWITANCFSLCQVLNPKPPTPNPKSETLDPKLSPCT
jgi:membrane protein insertase Oxa1/YidC/SpoIIIJ